MINDTKYFWKMLLNNPSRKIAWCVLFVMIWMSAGWIFHPIHSVVVLVGSAVIIVAISAYIAKLGYLQKINWGSRVHQNIATRGSIAIAALVTLYMFWGHNHIILFTIIGAIIIAVVLKDIVFHK